MSIEVSMKFLHKLKAISHIQVIVLGAPHFSRNNEIICLQMTQ